ncbi:hypothetical protein QQF64_025187 [Cirrhinus molitorella]|uniref:Uncharacterized protein n=1 Tax=Cirrhinus molitorella TaxID=172907 RepID=A0ABR3NNL9_9TELE
MLQQQMRASEREFGVHHKSLTFSRVPVDSAGFFSSGQLESVWWIPIVIVVCWWAVASSSAFPKSLTLQGGGAPVTSQPSSSLVQRLFE